MKNYFIFIAIFLGTLYSQCDSYTSSECDSNSNCEWIEDIEYGYCGNHNSAASCPNYTVCSWSCQGGWYLGECVGSYACTGGSYEFDNGSCNEILMPECSEMNESVCNSNGSCSWVESFSYGYCNNISWQQCENYSGCYVDSNPGWYDNSGPYCTGGTYQIDNSYCEEIEMPECNEEFEFQCTDGSCIPINRLCNNINDCEDESDEIDCESCSDFSTESNCNYLEECEWVEEIDSISCYSLSEINCGQVQGCNWGCSDWGDWYTWICYGTYMCLGGIVESDNSYCEEVALEQGDLNGDFLINILDVIEIINIILNNEWNYLADMNGDHEVNVLDIVAIVDIILGN